MDNEPLVLAIYLSIISANGFCSPGQLKQFSHTASLLRLLLPLLGLSCCGTVAWAIKAAERVGRPLGDRRAFLSEYISKNLETPCWFH
jgi:hypothetical protein